MKAVVVKKPGEIVMEEREIPVPPKGFARIRVKAAAICATDLELIDGNIPANYPIIPGHEWSGIVDAVGDEADSCWIGKSVIGSNDVVVSPVRPAAAATGATVTALKRSVSAVTALMPNMPSCLYTVFMRKPGM